MAFAVQASAVAGNHPDTAEALELELGIVVVVAAAVGHTHEVAADSILAVPGVDTAEAPADLAAEELELRYTDRKTAGLVGPVGLHLEFDRPVLSGLIDQQEEPEAEAVGLVLGLNLAVLRIVGLGCLTYQGYCKRQTDLWQA